jgi:hypothetical protein
MTKATRVLPSMHTRARMTYEVSTRNRRQSRISPQARTPRIADKQADRCSGR